MEQKQNKMGTQPVGKLLLTMSLPAMFSMLIQSLYNIVDSIFVAQLGEDALTAVSLAFPVQTMMIAVGVGTAVGINSLIARRLGERRFEDANNAAEHGILLGVASGILFAIFGLFFSRVFFESFTDSAAIIQMGVDYTSVVTIFSVGAFVQMNVERILQATGNMTYPMIFQLTGAITNIILDPIFIFGWFGVPAMGVRGAAIATVLGQLFAMALSIFVILVKKFEVKVNFKGFRLKMDVVKSIYVVGFPSIVMQAIASVLVTSLNVILMGFSGAAVSVLGVYYKLQSFVFMPVFGLNQGAMPILGYNFGARDKQRFMHCLWLTVAGAVVIMGVGTAIFQVFPVQLLMMFNASEEMLAIGVPALRTISLCFMFAGAGIVMSTAFQALGHGMRSLMVSLLRQLVVIMPLSWVFAHFIGLRAVWFAFPISEIVAMIASLVLFYLSYKQEIKDMHPQSSQS